ncbi:hypothetical protein Lal_00031903 [Lupinus albus]|nr:hypothetical protein Lal_00031903 [Lupinus albus]
MLCFVQNFRNYLCLSGEIKTLIVVTLGISRCRIAKRFSVSSLSVRLKDKERTEVLGWGYAERKALNVGTKIDLNSFTCMLGRNSCVSMHDNTPPCLSLGLAEFWPALVSPSRLIMFKTEIT